MTSARITAYRITTTGNTRPHEVATGYRYTQRNPAPIRDLPRIPTMIDGIATFAALAGFCVVMTLFAAGVA